MQQLLSQITHDPEFRRLKYVRYCDDFLLGYIGTRTEAAVIKQQITQFLQTIKLIPKDGLLMVDQSLMCPKKW